MRLLLAPLLLTACTAAEGQGDGTPIQSIYWSDGDSGRIDGTDFRLADVDAPETGGVGAVGGADCEAERELGFEAKAFMVDLTSNAELEIAETHGTDRYDRLVIDLNVEGVDAAEQGIAANHLRPWPHDGNRALSPKPDWCGER